jgi:hypothetical protein
LTVENDSFRCFGPRRTGEPLEKVVDYIMVGDLGSGFKSYWRR